MKDGKTKAVIRTKAGDHGIKELTRQCPELVDVTKTWGGKIKKEKKTRREACEIS